MNDETIAQARAAFGRGEHAQAAALAARVLERDAHALGALEVLALARREQGRLDEAERLLRSAIAAAPDRHWPYDDLARLLLARGRIQEAEQLCVAAIAADRANANAQAMLGGLLSEREALVEGAAHLRAAISLAGRHPELIANLGRNLGRQGRIAEAEPLLREAIAADPQALRPRAWLAELLERAQRFDEAVRALDDAEALAARQGTDLTLQRAALLSRTADWSRGLALLDAARDLSGAALLQRGRLRDRAGRHADAWADFVAGKAALALASGRAYPRAAVEALEAALCSFFAPENLAAMTPAPVRADVAQPIFILGFPRSGTTLTEQLLASHSQIRPGGELPFVSELAALAAELTRGAFPGRFEALDAAMRAELAMQLRDYYLSRAQVHGLTGPGAAFFTDKMPLNELYLPLLALAFPASPRVTVMRHPLDVIISAMSHDFTHGFDCGYRLGDLAQHFAATDALAAHWRERFGSHLLKYEQLVAAQEAETASLMAAVGLPMERAQLAFHESPRVAPTPSYAQVQERLNARSIGRWRNHADAMAPVRPVLVQAIARGGYAA